MATALKKIILVTGATGKQGRATITSLLAANALASRTIVAVTRNPASNAAKNLQDLGVRVVQGDLNDVPTIFANVQTALGASARIWGVFSVQTAIGRGASSASEERQGKALVDVALAHGVEHFVYASVERGGEERSWGNPTKVPHFVSKHNIEHHLRDSAKGSPMRWTIIRPVAFMENFTVGFGTKIMAAAWRVAVKNKPLQLVSTRDIGWFAAAALMKPDEYAGRAISLAGDQLTLAEANAVFKKQVGHDMPETFQFVARAVFWLSEEMGSMFRWFYDEGFGADVPALKREDPELRTWAEWLEKDSEWAKRK